MCTIFVLFLFDLYGFYTYMFNSLGIYEWIPYLDLLDYFLDERPTGVVEELTREYDSTKKCFGDDFDLPWSLDGVQSTGEGVAY